MHSFKKVFRADRMPRTAVALIFIGAAGCSSSSSGGGDGGSSSSGGSGFVAACASPGMATPGPADDRCATGGPDGGPLVNSVTSPCDFAIPQDSGVAACPYGMTAYGSESDDDDCKYHIAWTATPICEQPGSTIVTFVGTYKDSGKPLTGAAPTAEVFVSSAGDWDADTYCDIHTTHLGPDANMSFVEDPPGSGTYKGPVTFDKPGVWTVRFHLFENCSDWPTAPHGHVAFHFTVP
jgi:hypothetical protein